LCVQTQRTFSTISLTGIFIDSSNNTIFGGVYPISSEKVRILGDKNSSSVFDVSQALYADDSTISVEDGVGIYSGKTKLTATNSYFTRIYNVGESITLGSIFLPPNYTATTNITLTITDVASDSILYTEYNSIFSGYTGPPLTGITYNTGGLSRFHVTNKGNVGIGTTTPSEKLEVNGKTKTTNLQVTSGASTAGYVLIDSDGTGNVTWSPVSGLTGSVKKYSETLTSPSGGTYTITHSLGTNDIQVSLWLVATGDLTNARVTYRQLNSVDVVFSTSPGEDVRVVIIG
jgi:hypothetical protein